MTVATSRTLAFAAAVALVATACSGSTAPTPDSTGVRLVVAPRTLATQCVAAATALGFAVPCPRRVPARHGRPLACPQPADPGADAVPCVGAAGLPARPLFFLELSDFDVGARYQGVDGKAAGHVIVEARARDGNAPAPPCIGTVRGPGPLVAGRPSVEWRCSSDAIRTQRESRNGEGAHLGHLLFTWDVNGIDYSVSVHGYNTANRRLLHRLAGALELVPPGGPP